MDKWLTYDQVSLIPTKVSTLEHRAEADTSVQFGPLKLDLPLIAAPMPDVSDARMAEKLGRLGSFGWVHRFQDQFTDLKKIHPLQNLVGVAVSVQTTGFDTFYEMGVRIFCIDTANGANKMVEKAIKTLKDKYPEIFIVTGNVASFETFFKLQEWGADAIRVGIAGGSVCETRTETGVYSPMATVIREIQLQRTKEIQKALLIADGGIRKPADLVKAIALGADLVMVGGALAGTEESPGSVIKVDGKKFKLLRGAASYSVQNGNSEYNEGAETLVPYTGSVEKVIKRYAAGLRSAMSYFNARTLTEFRTNVKLVEVDASH